MVSRTRTRTRREARGSASSGPARSRARTELGHAEGDRRREPRARPGRARRIAEMAAERQSNREIAQAVFLTVKTVETHLSNAYRKLDIHSRAQLPRALNVGS